jgi:hypothetical protein
VIRGGSWDFGPAQLKTFARLKFYAANGHVSTGFRCARNANSDRNVDVGRQPTAVDAAGASAPKYSVSPDIAEALAAHGVTPAAVEQFWGAATKPASESLIGGGKVFGQWFEAPGDKSVRFVMARKTPAGWVFLSMLGRQWAGTAASLLNAPAPDEQLASGSRVLHEFLFEPEAFKFDECFKPGVLTCHE